MLMAKTSYKVLQERCIQQAPTRYAIFIVVIWDIIQFQTVSAVASCILGLLDKPEVLRKAQRELDSILKPGHLPHFDDEPALPYITAIVKETLRWRDVAPIGMSSQILAF